MDNQSSMAKGRIEIRSVELLTPRVSGFAGVSAIPGLSRSPNGSISSCETFKETHGLFFGKSWCWVQTCDLFQLWCYEKSRCWHPYVPGYGSEMIDLIDTQPALLVSSFKKWIISTMVNGPLVHFDPFFVDAKRASLFIDPQPLVIQAKETFLSRGNR